MNFIHDYLKELKQKRKVNYKAFVKSHINRCEKYFMVIKNRYCTYCNGHIC